MKPITKGLVTAIVGTSVGAVLGVAADDAVHGSLGMSTIVAIACCVSTIALLFFVSSLSGSVSALSGGLSGLSGSIDTHGEVVREAAKRSEEASDHASERLLDALAELRRQRGQTIEYQLIDPFSATVDSRYEDDLTLAVRRAVLYHRITQTPTPDSATIASASATYVRHCTAMCERREAGARNVLLRAASIRYPFKFILIDRTSLMLQLNRLTRDGEGRREAWCEIFFANTDPRLIHAFLDMWDDVDHDPKTRTLTSDQVIHRG